MYDFQHCFICRPSDSALSEDAGIEPRTVAPTALTVRRSNHSARSHPQWTRSCHNSYLLWRSDAECGLYEDGCPGRGAPGPQRRPGTGEQVRHRPQLAVRQVTFIWTALGNSLNPVLQIRDVFHGSRNRIFPSRIQGQKDSRIQNPHPHQRI